MKGDRVRATPTLLAPGLDSAWLQAKLLTQLRTHRACTVSKEPGPQSALSSGFRRILKNTALLDLHWPLVGAPEARPEPVEKGEQAPRLPPQTGTGPPQVFT